MIRGVFSPGLVGGVVAQGKRHNQALIALARRRSDVLYAMLRDGTLYQPHTTAIAA